MSADNETQSPVLAAEPTTEPRSICDRVHHAIHDLFAAQAIVDVVRMSISADNDYSRHYALQAAYDALGELASELEIIAVDARDAQEEAHA